MYITVNLNLPKEYDNVLEDICNDLNERDNMYVTMADEFNNVNNVDFDIELDRVAGQVIPGSAKIENGTIAYKIKILEGTPHGIILKQILEEPNKVNMKSVGCIDETTGMIERDHHEFLYPYFSHGEKTNFKLDDT